MTQSPRSLKTLILFIVVVMGGGIVIGTQTAPAEWFDALIKPSFNPPSWLFAPVWTLLYLCIAVAAWRVWPDGPMRRIWVAQLVLNFAWSPIFFVAHLMGLALCVILLLLVTILIFIARAWEQDRVAAVLFVPYAAWVGFASALNGAFLWLN